MAIESELEGGAKNDRPVAGSMSSADALETFHLQLGKIIANVDGARKI